MLVILCLISIIFVGCLNNNSNKEKKENDNVVKEKDVIVTADTNGTFECEFYFLFTHNNTNNITKVVVHDSINKEIYNKTINKTKEYEFKLNITKGKHEFIFTNENIKTKIIKIIDIHFNTTKIEMVV